MKTLSRVPVHILSLILCCFALVAQETTPGDPAKATPAKKIDQTGINWSLPFSSAIEKAKKENKLIAIKMIAGGTDHTGCW